MAVENDVAVNHLFRLEIVTPQKSVFSGEIESFTAPGASGSFQILRNHAPFLSTITVGEVKIRDVSGNESLYSTSGGFVEVSHNHVTFLAETIEKNAEIDVERARSAKERAETRLREKEPGIDFARARAALLRAVNRMKVAGK